MSETIRVMVVDDHAIVREGLCRLLTSQPDLEIVAEASDGREAVSLADHLQPDIVLMDLGMPDVNGIEATRRIKEKLASTRILILTAYEDKNLVRLALRAGADGYLLKNSDKEKLARAIRSVISEGRYFEPGMMDEEQGLSKDLPPAKAYDSLTRREREIFSLVAKGMKNREISEHLCISVKTVEKHRANLMKKLGLHSVAELVSCALKTGFLLRDQDQV